MIYVVTVHHRDPRWIPLQADYLRRNLAEPYRVFGSCEGIDERWYDAFDVVVPSIGAHAGKLNLLAAEVLHEAAPDDLLLFLDGDAFPIADPLPVVRAALATAALVAVRRDENLGDPQPHPSFCATTVRTWRELDGDWSAGHTWSGVDGRPVTDVGANLMRSLERSGLEWVPLLRSNTVDLHPLWFGVYGGVVYHHGSGFRRTKSRLDGVTAPPPTTNPLRHVPGVGRLVRHASARERHRRQLAAAYERDGAELVEAAQHDPDFWRRLVTT